MENNLKHTDKLVKVWSDNQKTLVLSLSLIEILWDELKNCVKKTIHKPEPLTPVRSAALG